MSIWFDCKKCGVALAAEEKKAGFRITCPECRARIKIPGIAMQSQASKEQIGQMYIAMKRVRQSFWILLILLIIWIAISFSFVSNSSDMDSDVSVVGIGLLIGIFLIVFVPILKLCEYLGGNKSVQVFMFLFLFPIWVIACIISYMKLQSRLEYLVRVGVRGDKIDPGRFNSLILE